MKQGGTYLFFFGVGSMVLAQIDMQFMILAWIDLWGPTTGWAIRGGMAVAGALLWFAGHAQEQNATAS